MQQLKLSATKRVVGKEGKRKKTDTQVRGVVYGREVESTPIMVDYQTLAKLYSEAGSNHVVELEVEGEEPKNVLFKDVQYDPVTNNVAHFDLYAVKKGEKLKANVPITITGESPAVIRGAQLTTFLEEVEVECIPSKLPDQFELDVSTLEEIGDTLSVSDIKVDEDVAILADMEQAVVRAEEIRELQVEEPEAETAEGEEGEEGEGEEGEEGEDESAETDADSEEES